MTHSGLGCSLRQNLGGPSRRGSGGIVFLGDSAVLMGSLGYLVLVRMPEALSLLTNFDP